MIRIAAVGDVHFGPDSAGTFRPCLDRLQDEADLLLLAGDLTKTGHPDEARVLATELDGVRVPMVGVLGNHDYHSDRQDEVRRAIEDAGVTVLEGEHTVVETRSGPVGIAGGKGFGGGFTGSSGTEFGEPQMKAFIRHSRELACDIERALGALDGAALKVALTHYSPVRDTLAGEPPEIFPFLGSYLLAEAVDTSGADLAVHGHAHRGTEKGLTPAGVYVRNVAMTVIRRPYAVYSFDGAVGRRDRSLAALVDSRARSARPRGARDGRAAR